MWQPLIDLIRSRHRFLLTTHINPDGDGIGSELALAAYLRGQGKDVAMVNPSPLPRLYQFLDPGGLVETYDPGRHEPLLRSREVAIVLDISVWERLGPLGGLLPRLPCQTVCIDHHPANGRRLGDLAIVREEACATGELVYDLLRALGAGLDRTIAEPLYVSILTDTGSFRFSNTIPRAHRIAADLLEAGVRPQEVYQALYESSSAGRLKLLGRALGTLRTADGGRLAWMSVAQDMFDSAGALPEETEGFVDYLRLLAGVEVCLLFIELSTGRVKVSLRSRGIMDVNRLASLLGGGGHPHAAGVVVQGSLPEVVPRVVAEVERVLATPVGPSRG